MNRNSPKKPIDNNMENETHIIVQKMEKNWYRMASGFGGMPFEPGSLSDSVRTNPYGAAGGDAYTGVLEPSSGEHHANDYFSEGDHTAALEKRLQDLKKKKMKRRKIHLIRPTAQMAAVDMEEDENKIESENEQSQSNDLGGFQIAYSDPIDNVDMQTVKRVGDLLGTFGVTTLRDHSGWLHQLVMDERTKYNIANVMKASYEHAVNRYPGVRVVGDLQENDPSIYQRLADGIRKVWSFAPFVFDPGIRIANKFSWYRFSQWGAIGPKLPTWGKSNWVADTYERILDWEDRNLKNRKKKKNRKKHVYYDEVSMMEPSDHSDHGVLERVASSTVTVESRQGERGEEGAGFFIAPNALLTCAHVAIPNHKQSSNDLRIFAKIDGQQYVCSLWSYDPKLDIALLIVNDPNFIPHATLNMGSAQTIGLGDNVYAVGSPLGFENVVNQGIVAMKPRELSDHGISETYMFVTNNLSSGNSGGPVVNAQTGDVIGIAAAVLTGENGAVGSLNAVIPVDVVRPWLQQNGIHL